MSLRLYEIRVLEKERPRKFRKLLKEILLRANVLYVLPRIHFYHIKFPEVVKYSNLESL